jgi:hypothetical protein
LQRSILTKLELREPFEKSGFPTGQKRRFLIFATEPFPLLEDAGFDALDAHISRGRAIVSDVRGPVPAKKGSALASDAGLKNRTLGDKSARSLDR